MFILSQSISHIEVQRLRKHSLSKFSIPIIWNIVAFLKALAFKMVFLSFKKSLEKFEANLI